MDPATDTQSSSLNNQRADTVEPTNAPQRAAFDFNGTDTIPVAEWGRDHWSTLAYIETRCVDAGGVIDNDRMRCNWRRHRKLVGPRQFHAGADGVTHPTRLVRGTLCRKHDDWDCLNDMVAAGYVEIVDEEDQRPLQQFGGIRVTVRMTDAGMRAAGELRRHKAAGGAFGTFVMAGDVEAATQDATKGDRQ